MKEKINITIENLDDLPNVLRSLELLFQKLLSYYTDNDVTKVNLLILSISVYFGKLLRVIGYNEDGFKED